MQSSEEEGACCTKSRPVPSIASCLLVRTARSRQAQALAPSPVLIARAGRTARLPSVVLLFRPARGPGEALHFLFGCFGSALWDVVVVGWMC